MKYRITMSHEAADHWNSQVGTMRQLFKAGFKSVKWEMGTYRALGPDWMSVHRWRCEGDEECVLALRLAAIVDKVEIIETE